VSEAKKLKLKDLKEGDKFRFVDEEVVQMFDWRDPEDGLCRCLDRGGGVHWYAGVWDVERISE
jgi:hypothetical protein